MRFCSRCSDTRVTSFKLSILFMRFIVNLRKQGVDLSKLSILFMRFLAEYRYNGGKILLLSILFMRFPEKGADVSVESENFQFSLWDSNSICKKYAFVCKLSILFMRFFRSRTTKISQSKTFNSLYEIHGNEIVIESSSNNLSILFMRFNCICKKFSYVC